MKDHPKAGLGGRLEDCCLVVDNGSLLILGEQHFTPHFSGLAITAMASGVDRVVIELPWNLPASRTREMIAKVHPHPGLVIVPIAEPKLMPVPYVPGQLEPTRKVPVVEAGFLPIGAYDSLGILSGRGIPMDFVDAGMPSSVGFSGPPPGPIQEIDPEELVNRRGYTECYERWKPMLERVPGDAYFDFRNRVMAARLLQIREQHQGERVLFLCGLRHVPPIIELLRSRHAREPLDSTVPFEPGELRYCTVEPATAFSWGFMDVPHYIGSYHRRFLRGNSRYSRADLFDDLVAAAYDAARRLVSPRQLLNLKGFAERLALNDGRWSADLDRHILPAGESAVGSSFAGILEQTAMQLELERPEDVPHAKVIPGGGGKFFVQIESGYEEEIFLLRFPTHAPGTKPRTRPLRLPKTDDLTPEEKSTCDKSSLLSKPPPEAALFRECLRNVREHTKRLLNAGKKTCRSVPADGVIDQDLDWRRTVRSHAMGEDQTYVFRRVRPPTPTVNCRDCPVVILFQDGPVGSRFGDFYHDDRDGFNLYSSFYWMVEKSRRYVGNRVRENTIAYMLRLYRKDKGDDDRDVVLNLIDSIAPDLRCPEEIWYDDELFPRFKGIALAIAGGVRWAENHVAIVNAMGKPFNIPVEVLAFAEERGIGLVTLSVDQLQHPLHFARLAVDTECPTPGHYQKPYAWASRFARACPGFEEDDSA